MRHTRVIWLLSLIMGVSAWPPAAYCQPGGAWLEIEAQTETHWFEQPVSDGCAYGAWGRLYRSSTGPGSVGVVRTPLGETPLAPYPAWWRAEATARIRTEHWEQHAICSTGRGWRDSFVFESWLWPDTPGCDASCWHHTGEFHLSCSESVYTEGEHWPLHVTVPGAIVPPLPGEVYEYTIDIGTMTAYGQVAGFPLASLAGNDTATVTVWDGGWRIYIGPTFAAADFDRDGACEVADIVAFFTAWFADDPRARWTGGAACVVADIFAFLTAWFAG